MTEEKRTSKMDLKNLNYTCYEKNEMNQRVQCLQTKVNRELASEFVFDLWGRCLKKTLGSYFECHVRQLVALKDSESAYSIHKP